jgi:hypothetical protein
MLKNFIVLSFVLLMLARTSFTQVKDSTTHLKDSATTEAHFSGAISATNNGISLVPTFSLGKPAVLFNLSIGKGRLSFDPDIRFAMEGKPWSFLFWWRYKLLYSGKFKMTVGAHPALNFKTSTVLLNGVSKDLIITRRYMAAELFPNYLLSKTLSVGVYYLYSRGIDKDATRNTHFLTLNGTFSNIQLTDQYFVKFTPQLYYLNQDNVDGYYCTASMTLARKNFPLSLSAIMNKTIKTNIAASKNFVWNLSLVYAFNKKYVEKR